MMHVLIDALSCYHIWNVIVGECSASPEMACTVTALPCKMARDANVILFPNSISCLRGLKAEQAAVLLPYFAWRDGQGVLYV